MVVIFSKENDIHSLAVKFEVEQSGHKCLIIDSAKFPEHLNLENIINSGTNSSFSKFILDDKIIDSSEIIGVWRRRIRSHEVSSLLNDTYKEVSRRDSKSFLDGFLLTLATQKINILNNPLFETPALNKTYQLEIARQVGLKIPDTIITNNKKSASKFFTKLTQENKKIIYKAFNSPEGAVITTNFMTSDDLKRIDSLKYSPVIFQEYIEGKDLRITYVGGDIFPAEVLITSTEANRDWRIEVNNTVIPSEISNLQTELIHKLMKSLRLDYGAIDVKLTDEGDMYFLEVNPWGQYLFVEIQTEQKISKAIAHFLTK